MNCHLGQVFNDLSILVTGHTGFKGAWLSLWLCELGVRVIGYSLQPPTTPNLFELCHLADRIVDVRGDVRDLAHLEQTVAENRPHAIFHLAAQPLVLPSYRQPQETFDINVGGTVNLLEAVRRTGTVRAVVCITTDKVYKNREWLWGYREIDELGGHDPYSASKAMAELAVASYRQSFFSIEKYQEHRVALASARAGNVIGGGDWAAERLIPDLVRALVSTGSTDEKPLHLRNPNYVRPWQIVFESLSGYLWLAAQLLGPDAPHFAEAWNFGPGQERAVTTREVVEKAIDVWGGGEYTCGTTQTEVETALLRLNGDKAASRLGWQPAYGWEEAVVETMRWYRTWFERQTCSKTVDMYDVCVSQLGRYVDAARVQGLAWAG